MPWYRDALVAGMNFRMSNLHAAVGYAQLGRLEKMNGRRRQIAEEYNSRLQRVDGIELPVVAPGCEHTYQMYTICVGELLRDRIVGGLRQMGVMASVHFAPAVHQQTFYRALAGNMALPVTEKLSRSILSLPIYPDMSDEEVDYVCHSVEVCLNRIKNTSS
jgi:dTDP-4-amino-4,6-dideoxygalactose transaminase